METAPRHIQVTEPGSGSTTDRPVCEPLESLDRDPLLLEEATTGTGSRLPVTCLGRESILCIPPIHFDTPGTSKNQEGAGGASATNHTSLPEQAMVWHAPLYVQQLPGIATTASKVARECSGRSTSPLLHNHILSSRLDVVRDRYICAGVSESGKCGLCRTQRTNFVHI